MAKAPPPKLNVGSVTAAKSGGFQRPLPSANPDPDVNPAAAALAAAAPVHTVEPPKAVEDAPQQEPSPMAEPAETVRSPSVAKKRSLAAPPPPSAERFAPKFSLGGDVVDVLDSLVRRARRKSGDDITQSRVVSAGLLALAELSDADLVAAIGKVAVRPRGRKPAGGKQGN